MLNEINEVKALLDGKRINKKNTYRSCYLLAKYFKSLQFDMIKTREEIFTWAKKQSIYITDDLNSIIQRAFNDKHDLVNNIEVLISKDDVEEIKKRFDQYNTRLTAFAILSFAKIYADKNGIFQMSLVGLSNWINIKQPNIAGRIIKELVDFGYIDKVEKRKYIHIKQKNKPIHKPIVYKIKVDFKNVGEKLFRDSDIRQEFESIFTYYE